MGKHYGEKVIKKVKAMRESGCTHREIGLNFGLSQEQIRELLKRYRRKERNRAAGIEPLPKGRPRARALTQVQTLQLRVKQLEREVELYRCFLQAAGRM